MPLANIEDILVQHDKPVKPGMDYVVVTPSMIAKKKREGWTTVTTMQGTVDQMLVVMERKTPPPPSIPAPEVAPAPRPQVTLAPKPTPEKPVVRQTKSKFFNKGKDKK